MTTPTTPQFEDLTPAQQANLTEWVEALESDRFPQDPSGGYLKNNGKFCCLGVLEELRGNLQETLSDGVFRTAEGSLSLPPQEAITEYLGLPNGCTIEPGVPDERYGSLQVLRGGRLESVHVLNDRGVPFQEIARLIRETYGMPPAQ